MGDWAAQAVVLYRQIEGDSVSQIYHESKIYSIDFGIKDFYERFGGLKEIFSVLSLGELAHFCSPV